MNLRTWESFNQGNQYLNIISVISSLKRLEKFSQYSNDQHRMFRNSKHYHNSILMLNPTIAKPNYQKEKKLSRNYCSR